MAKGVLRRTANSRRERLALAIENPFEKKQRSVLARTRGPSSKNYVM